MEWLENIKKLKKEKGLTNESLSEKSGISVGTLNKLLSGATTDPKLSTLRPLADALEVSLDELLAIRKEDAPGLPAALAAKYGELDDSGRETVEYIIHKERQHVAAV